MTDVMIFFGQESHSIKDQLVLKDWFWFWSQCPQVKSCMLCVFCVPVEPMEPDDQAQTDSQTGTAVPHGSQVKPPPPDYSLTSCLSVDRAH